MIEELKNKQRRLAAYRSLIFWAYPTIRRKERKSLPSCVYMMVRASYMPSDDEEFAEHNFSVYVPEFTDDDV